VCVCVCACARACKLYNSINYLLDVSVGVRVSLHIIEEEGVGEAPVAEVEEVVMLVTEAMVVKERAVLICLTMTKDF